LACGVRVITSQVIHKSTGNFPAKLVRKNFQARKCVRNFFHNFAVHEKNKNKKELRKNQKYA